MQESKLLAKALEAEFAAGLRPSRFASRRCLSWHLDRFGFSAGTSTDCNATGLIEVSHGELFSRGESKPGTASRCWWRVLPGLEDGVGVADTGRHPVHGDEV
jgi:hypothetical protein